MITQLPLNFAQCFLLSQREMQVLRGMANGKTQDQIADEMGLSAQHIQVILKHYEELK